ncbi:hypothetical protein EI983_13590 [Roseovarius faecimaris]|uniref:CBU-0592-like domain-containing protein n=1 Tax=Roseovarius faecimaris TaxID=2494550 RepID=A0A6I6ITZ2_9RHOB|nr:hypothetical protein [Roseovarius faecimaris]QGX99241.1 hypothetical protein EI983_13590 [Roseovarius faecimaris]
MTELLTLLEAPPLSPLQWIGVVGFAIYMLGFLLVQTGHMDGNGMLFPGSKVIAALCVMCSLTEAFNLATLLVQISFVVIGTYGVAARLLRLRSARRQAAIRFHPERRTADRRTLSRGVGTDSTAIPLPLHTPPSAGMCTPGGDLHRHCPPG